MYLYLRWGKNSMGWIVICIDGVRYIQPVIAHIINTEHIQVFILVFANTFCEVRINSRSYFVEDQARVVQDGLEVRI